MGVSRELGMGYRKREKVDLDYLRPRKQKRVVSCLLDLWTGEQSICRRVQENIPVTVILGGN